MLTVVTDYYVVPEVTAVITNYDVSVTETLTTTVTAAPKVILVHNPAPTVTITQVITSTKLLGYGACGPHATTLS